MLRTLHCSQKMALESEQKHPTLGWALPAHVYHVTKVFAYLLLAVCHTPTPISAAVKKCQTNSSRCSGNLPTPDGSPVCSERGLFPYQSDCRFYLLCPEKGFRPCLCHCRLPDMHFDRWTKKCKFSFLPLEPECHRRKALVKVTDNPMVPSRYLVPSSQSKVDMLKNIYYRSFSHRHSVQELGNIIRKYEDRKNKTINSHNSNNNNKLHSFTVDVHRGNKSTIVQTLSVHPTHTESQEGKPSYQHDNGENPEEAVEDPRKDPSNIPAWAIAIIVFAIVLIVVAVVLSVY